MIAAIGTTKTLVPVAGPMTAPDRAGARARARARGGGVAALCSVDLSGQRPALQLAGVDGGGVDHGQAPLAGDRLAVPLGAIEVEDEVVGVAAEAVVQGDRPGAVA